MLLDVVVKQGGVQRAGDGIRDVLCVQENHDLMGRDMRRDVRTEVTDPVFRHCFRWFRGWAGARGRNWKRGYVR